MGCRSAGWVGCSDRKGSSNVVDIDAKLKIEIKVENYEQVVKKTRVVSWAQLLEFLASTPSSKARSTKP